MGFTEVKAYLDTAGYGDRVTEFTVSSATVELAAQARIARRHGLRRRFPLW